MQRGGKTMKRFRRLVPGFALLTIWLTVFCPGWTASAQTSTEDVVFDAETKLFWQKGEAGTMTWQTAINYCEALVLDGYSDWRLPASKELEISYRKRILFPGFKGWRSYYWSSTDNQDDPNYAWGMYASGGRMFDNGRKSSKYNVRCVRNDLEACITIKSVPEFGTVYAPDGEEMGEAPVTLCSRLAPDKVREEDLNARGFTVRWISGVTQTLDVKLKIDRTTSYTTFHPPGDELRSAMEYAEYKMRTVDTEQRRKDEIVRQQRNADAVQKQAEVQKHESFMRDLDRLNYYLEKNKSTK
jgi:hypothetical protein